ncbi:hypothetical protein AAG570_003466 [Ranatra chinensis]|uniref:Uncharacterized protein n=1 Tax=Ranatra chinensis TaxID=642074 RepID=A0ABD0Y3R5_9HEMI
MLQSTSQNLATENIESLSNKIDNALQNLQNNWHRTSEVLENQQSTLSEILYNAIKAKDDLTSKFTQELQALQNNIQNEFEADSLKLKQAISDMYTSLAMSNKNITKSITEGSELTNGFYDIVQRSFDQLSTDVKSLSKVEKVMIQTADNVMDTKRRIEYGVQQILLEVGDLIKLQGKDINMTMNKRFDLISEKILDNQNGGLTNLSSKIETEISQVWRQIGIMYQQLTASAGALDKLQQQTEIYVNGSLQTMDSMEGKVGLITGRITEVDDNLNYLLGKLSLVTQEFNQIKSALANALDNIRNSFQSVQQKIKDVGPGPNPIDSNSALDVDNTL